MKEITVTSSFYAYSSRLRWIKRWGLKRNAHEENVMEHSWEVSVIAHTLALIKNRYYGGTVDPNAIATAALYHDITKSLPAICQRLSSITPKKSTRLTSK